MASADLSCHQLATYGLKWPQRDSGDLKWPQLATNCFSSQNLVGARGNALGKSVKHNLMEVTFYFTNLCITFFNDFSLKVKFRHMKEELDLESFINSIYDTKGFKSILCVSD